MYGAGELASRQVPNDPTKSVHPERPIPDPSCEPPATCGESPTGTMLKAVPGAQAPPLPPSNGLIDWLLVAAM